MTSSVIFESYFGVDPEVFALMCASNRYLAVIGIRVLTHIEAGDSFLASGVVVENIRDCVANGLIRKFNPPPSLLQLNGVVLPAETGDTPFPGWFQKLVVVGRHCSVKPPEATAEIPGFGKPRVLVGIDGVLFARDIAHGEIFVGPGGMAGITNIHGTAEAWTKNGQIIQMQ